MTIFEHNMIATYQKHTLNFKQASGTSRGILKTKDTWYLIIDADGKKGVGECGMFKGLSSDDRPDFEAVLKWTCQNIFLGKELLLSKLKEFPSLQFGLEMAFLDLESKTAFELFPSKFTEGKDHMPINGLIWMGSETFMKDQIKSKIEEGFTCIKLKIGAIDFQTELDLLKSIRTHFSASDIELRVDANGAFSPKNALEKLKRLSDFHLHSIEQPIKQGQIEEMAKLCEITPLDIALDEELIGIFDLTDKFDLLQTIKPQYIILKPTLVGGFQGSNDWIETAKEANIGYWITSALESNVGLNAIAQWTYTLHNEMPQGLGTGGLYTNNFESPLQVKNGGLHYNKTINWNFNL